MILIQLLSLTKNKYLDIILFILVFILSTALIAHKLHGFHNILLYPGIRLSNLSSEYNLYINFDKPCLLMLGIYYLRYNNIYLSNCNLKKTLYITLFLLISAIIVLLVPSFLLNYLKFDPKLPSILLEWSSLNLLTVASEEMLFRGFLLTYIVNKIGNTKYGILISLLISSLCFGLFHYQGGYLYIALSFIAGIFYGKALLNTGSLLSSITVHFGVNLCHIILFTYPSLQI